MGELDQGQCPLKGQFTLLRTYFHPEKEILWKLFFIRLFSDQNAVPCNKSSNLFFLTKSNDLDFPQLEVKLAA